MLSSTISTCIGSINGASAGLDIEGVGKHVAGREEFARLSCGEPLGEGKARGPGNDEVDEISGLTVRLAKM